MPTWVHKSIGVGPPQDPMIAQLYLVYVDRVDGRPTPDPLLGGPLALFR